MASEAAPTARALCALLKTQRTSGFLRNTISAISVEAAAATMASPRESSSSAPKLQASAMFMVMPPSASRTHSNSPARQAANQIQKSVPGAPRHDAAIAATASAAGTPTITARGGRAFGWFRMSDMASSFACRFERRDQVVHALGGDLPLQGIAWAIPW